jgi:hypothetical protein
LRYRRETCRRNLPRSDRDITAIAKRGSRPAPNRRSNR